MAIVRQRLAPRPPIAMALVRQRLAPRPPIAMALVRRRLAPRPPIAMALVRQRLGTPPANSHGRERKKGTQLSSSSRRFLTPRPGSARPGCTPGRPGRRRAREWRIRLRRYPHLPLVSALLAAVLRLDGRFLSLRWLDLLPVPESVFTAAAFRAGPCWLLHRPSLFSGPGAILPKESTWSFPDPRHLAILQRTATGAGPLAA
jgi:hypothetical protein